MTIAIVGDVLHSRVARSDAQIFRTLGAENIRLIGPPALCPPTLEKEFHAPVFADMDSGLENADAVVVLRAQRERLCGDFYSSPQEYFDDYGMTEKRLAKLKPSAVIMHPGPINRGVEIADTVADGKQSLILQQVTNGMAIRKAALIRLCSNGRG